MNFLDPVVGIILLVNAVVILTVFFGRRGNTAWRTTMCVACATGVISYLGWRLHYILYGGGLSTVEGFWTKVLFGMEVVCFADFFIFLLCLSRYKDRTQEADAGQEYLEQLTPDQLPEVDILVATYNEDWEILEKTILSINAIDYPKKKGYLLDDGKRDWLKAKCEAIGFGYIRRAGSAHKKPGNHNYALSQTSAPFIAVFDADFIAMPSFIRRTLGILLTNPDIGIIQSPQSFYNYDPMRQNLKLEEALPDDTAMFFTVMEPCRDAWGCAFYVGSSALMRREAINKIGGIVMGYDTEDQITSIAMLQQGFRTVFLNETLSIGLAPESLKALFEQRKRWARGSIQILFSKHGPFGPNLSPLQRILFGQTFWLVGFISPIVYAFVPPSLWLFQIRLFPYMPPEEVFLIPVLLFLCVNLSIWWLSHGLWYPIVSPALQLLLSFEVLPTILTTLIKPFGRPLLKFVHVTPKGREAQDNGKVNWKTLKWLLAIIFGTGVGIALYLSDDYKFITHPDELKAALFWTFMSLLVVVVASISCISPIYKRSSERFALCIKVKLSGGAIGSPLEGVTKDISLHGCRVWFDRPVPQDASGKLFLEFQGLGYTEAREVRRSSGCEVSFKMLNVPKATESALFAKLFLNPEHHAKELLGAVSLYIGCMKRLIGKLE